MVLSSMVESDNLVTPVPIVLFSYRRPTMTARALSSLLLESNGQDIHVSIDGLARSASNEEGALRQSTIRAAEEIAQTSNRIHLHVWEENFGITAHAMRIFERLFETSNEVVSIEEDLQIENAGLTFLQNQILAAPSGSLVSAYCSHEHQLTEESNSARLTNFPEQWATAFDAKVYEEFLRLQKDKKVDRSVVRSAMAHTTGSFLKREALVDYWTELISKAANRLNHGDALIQYGCWKSGNVPIAPWNSFVADLGATAPGGLTLRSGADNRKVRHLPQMSSSHIQQIRFCNECENQSAQYHRVSLYRQSARLLRRTITPRD